VLQSHSVPIIAIKSSIKTCNYFSQLLDFYFCVRIHSSTQTSGLDLTFTYSKLLADCYIIPFNIPTTGSSVDWTDVSSSALSSPLCSDAPEESAEVLSGRAHQNSQSEHRYSSRSISLSLSVSFSLFWCPFRDTRQNQYNSIQCKQGRHQGFWAPVKRNHIGAPPRPSGKQVMLFYIKLILT